VDLARSGDIELLVISAVGTFHKSIFLAMALMILDQPTAKASDQLTQLCDLHPGLAPELLTIVNRKDNLGNDPV